MEGSGGEEQRESAPIDGTVGVVESNNNGNEALVVAAAPVARPHSLMETAIEAVLTHLMEFFDVPSRIKLAAGNTTFQRLIYQCSALWETIDLSGSTIPEKMLNSLTDEMLAVLLHRVNAWSTTKSLVLEHCWNVFGTGLEPLRHSELLERAVLGLPHGDVEALTNILRTILPHNLCMVHFTVMLSPAEQEYRREFFRELQAALQQRANDRTMDGHPYHQLLSEADTLERKCHEVERLFEALDDGDFETVGPLLDQLPAGEKLSNIRHYQRGSVLHVAVSSEAPFATVQRLMEAIDIGWCLKQQDSHGRSPLHLVRWIDRDDPDILDVARIILEADPGLICHQDKRKMTPLHLYDIVSHTNLVTFLLGQPGAQEALAMQNWLGYTPLHFACCDPLVPPDILEALISKFSGALQMQNYDGNVPLHLALANNTNQLAIETLISSYPVALQATNSMGQVPLHLACESADAPTIQVLLALLSEDDLVMMDGEGLTPLATCCYNRRGNAILEAVYNAAPHALLIRDLVGLLPIHHAVSRNPRRSNITYEHNPIEFLVGKGGHDLLGMQDFNGQTPLHRVCSSSVDLYSLPSRYFARDVTLLVEMYPAALQIHDANGDRPIDLFESPIRSFSCGEYSGRDSDIAEQAIALMPGRPDASLHSVLRHPECSPNLARFFVVTMQAQVASVDENGYLPLHIIASRPLVASETDFHRETIEHLLRIHPNACRARNHQGAYPLTLMAQVGKGWNSGMDLVFLQHPPALSDLRPPLNGQALCELLRKTARDGQHNGLFFLLKDMPDVLLQQLP